MPMQHLLFHWVVTAVAVLIASKLVPGVKVSGFATALGVAAVFGILNAVFGWALFTFFGIATLGVGFLLAAATRWLVNTILLQITDWLIGGFSISGWGAAALASLVISGISAFGNYLFPHLR